MSTLAVVNGSEGRRGRLFLSHLQLTGVVPEEIGRPVPCLLSVNLTSCVCHHRWCPITALGASSGSLLAVAGNLSDQQLRLPEVGSYQPCKETG